MYALARCLLVLLTTAAWLSSASAQTIEYSKVDKATVRVFSLRGVQAATVRGEKKGQEHRIAVADAGHGSGVLLERGGLIATAQHVIDDATLVAVMKPGDEEPYLAEVVYASKRHDVAFLVIAGEHQSTIALPAEVPALKSRQTAFAIGYPLDSTRIHPQSSRGVVAGVTDDGELQLSMPVNPGNSGGPVVDESDTLLGVVSRGADPTKGAQGIAIASAVSQVKRLRNKVSSKKVKEARQRLKAADSGHVAALVADFTQQGHLIGDILDAMDEGKLPKLRKRAKKVYKSHEDSPDALVLVCAYYWNEAIARFVTSEDGWRKAQKVSNAVCNKALKLDATLLQRSPFLETVLERSQINKAKRAAHQTQQADLQDTAGTPLAKAPTSLAGFRLGWSVGKARKACQGEGHEWKRLKDGYRCSGTAREIALDGYVELGVCAEKLCRVALYSRPSRVESGPWTQTFTAVKQRYQKKLGEPKSDLVKMPSDCRRTVLPCLKSGRAVLKYSWTWPEAKRTVAMGQHAGLPAIQVKIEKR